MSSKIKKSEQPESIRARRQFKALVRLVIDNRFWLEDVGDEKLGVNVARNIHLLTKKKKHGSKDLLSLKVKSLLFMPSKYRTEQDVSLLCDNFENLKCFKSFTVPVKRKLARVVHYRYYSARRTIIRQHHKAHAIYFIISGTVSISFSQISVFNEMVNTNAGYMGEGAMFGQVAFLYDMPRTATITTITDCEFLVLSWSDVDDKMSATIHKQWSRTLKAIKRFSYFKQWDELTIRECCILSKLKSYKRDETLLGDGEGFKNCVYFLLKGRCRVIEHLLMTSNCTHGTKTFKLFKKEKQSSLDMRNKYKSYNETLSSSDFNVEEDLLISTSNLNEEEYVGASSSKARLPSSVSLHLSESTKKMETKFMQICVLSELACFGVGENMQNRRIVAVTDVECLLIPRDWIMQRNTSNVWTRIQQYLNAHIPNTDSVFKYYVTQRKWREHKKMLVETYFKNKSKVNNISNVPYSIRIQQDFDFIE